MWPGRTIGTFDFTCRAQRWGNFEHLYLSSESRFKKKKRAFLVYGLRNVLQKCRTSAVNRKYRSGQADNW